MSPNKRQKRKTEEKKQGKNFRIRQDSNLRGETPRDF